jgi:hypothetical protein
MAWSVILSVSFFFLFRRCGFSSAGVRDAWTQQSLAPWLGMDENMLYSSNALFFQGNVVKDGGGGGGKIFGKKYFKNDINSIQMDI